MKGWGAGLLLLVGMGVGGCVGALNGSRADFLNAPQSQSIPRVFLTPFRIDGALLLDVRLDAQQASNACGAHALASVINYWSEAFSNLDASVQGVEIYAQNPPLSAAGYSLAEMADIARKKGLSALAVSLTMDGIRNELKSGRPVIVRVSLPAGYQQNRYLLPSIAPLRWLEGVATDRVATVTGRSSALSLDHYWVVAGYDAQAIIVLDPALGLRRIRADHFETYFNKGGNQGVVIGGWL